MKTTLLFIFCASLLVMLQQPLVAQPVWTVTGNTGTNPSTDFLGTRDNKALVFRTNNTERMRIGSNGNVGIGIKTPMQKLDVNGNINIHACSGLYIDYIRVLHTTGENFFAGPLAGNSITTGFENMASGSGALYSNTTGFQNTAVGFSALNSNTTGYQNTGVGDYVLNANTTGTYNTAIGLDALLFNTTGSNNSALGMVALFNNTTGSANTASGIFALDLNASGNGNTASGYAALQTNSTGNYNSALGYYANLNDANLSNSTAIGNNSLITASNQVRIGNSSVTSIGGYANWSNISDGRVKKNIKNNVPGLAFINKLQPITYTLDLNAADRIIQRPQAKDKDGKIIQSTQDEINSKTLKEQVIYTGFIAQDVEKAAKSLNYDFSGVDIPKNAKDLYGLRYAEFVVPLVKAVQELAQQNDSLKRRNDELEARLEKIESIVLKGQSQILTQSVELTNSAKLEQNIPNPFSGMTTIGYYLPAHQGNAYINFYASSGILLKSIKLKSSGNGTIDVKVNELPSGVYQYALIIDGKVIDKKQMMQVK